MPYSSADSLSRHMLTSILPGDDFSNFSVSHGPSVGDCQQNFPDGSAEGSSLRRKRRCEIRKLGSSHRKSADAFLHALSPMSLQKTSVRQTIIRIVFLRHWLMLFLPVEKYNDMYIPYIFTFHQLFSRKKRILLFSVPVKNIIKGSTSFVKQIRKMSIIIRMRKENAI